MNTALFSSSLPANVICRGNWALSIPVLQRAKNMADVESLFEFVHMEIVAYFLNKPGKNIDVSVNGVSKVTCKENFSQCSSFASE